MNYYNYIAHYGVPGMKKGKRRWTNADGTLNEAGKKRYASGQVGDTGVKAVPATLSDGSKSNKTFFYLNQRGQTIGTSSSVYPMTDADHKKNIQNLTSMHSGKKKADESKKSNVSTVDKDRVRTKVSGQVGFSRQAVSNAVRGGVAVTNAGLRNKEKKKKKGQLFVSKFLNRFK